MLDGSSVANNGEDKNSKEVTEAKANLPKEKREACRQVNLSVSRMT
ncbi:hypothetical protein HLB35_05550 [Halomonas sp. TBZ9]|uniref:Uncharacterized protein n=1 Tax=Vreelandella azerica TaxID=2732867 RepID=A0A7Y3XAJ2_9GAMM|nr:hypothetical protein [Halomonas azerica]NOG31363.1 hypothetical protein [Halomonas azerica]